MNMVVQTCYLVREIREHWPGGPSLC